MTTRPGYVWDATASEFVAIGQAAVLAPIKYQASAPSSPATGDIWIDSDDDVPSVDSTLYYRWTKTMSGGQTSISGTDDSSLALEYTPGYESVFINGVLQVRGLDYVASTGTTITGLTALTASDVVMVESIVAYSVGDTYTQSQTNSLLDAKSPVSTTGLVLVSSTTIGSAVTSVVVSNVFSATYDSYKIVITGGTSSVAQENLTLQLGSTTAGYYWAWNYVTYTGTGAATAGNNVASWRVGRTNVNYLSVNIDIVNPFLSNRKYFYAVGASGNESGMLSGMCDFTTSITGFTLSVGSGTITGGTIKVYGYK